MAGTVKYVKGNALDYAAMDGYCMIHVCNNKGGFGGGKTAIATQVAELWPEAKENYLASGYSLGQISVDAVDTPRLNTINMVAQDGFGARWKGVKYFNEEAFDCCLRSIANANQLMTECYKIHTIVVPYKMGADRAGGDWDWIIAKVEEVLGEYFDILVVEYDGGDNQ